MGSQFRGTSWLCRVGEPLGERLCFAYLLLNDMAERVGDVFVSAFKEAGYDPKAAPIYATALIGMVTFVVKWWTEERKPSVEDVAKHISALAWMGLRHLPKRPTLAIRPD